MMWIHSILTSTVNGPGRRAVIWMSGCNLGCPSCFNPSTHAFETGAPYSPRQLFGEIQGMEGIEGITLSGGEPLLQDQDLMEFLHLVKTYTNLSVLIFSGLTLTEIKRRLKKNKTEAILDRVDILKTGRYRAGRPTKAPLRGSANQRLYFLTQRYTPDDLPPKAFEVIVRSSGERVITGFPPQRNFTD